MNRPLAAILSVATLVILPSHDLDAQRPDGDPLRCRWHPRRLAPGPAGRLPDRRTTRDPRVRRNGGSHLSVGLAILPDRTMLVTERLGSLRLIRDGSLHPTPVSGVPEVFTGTALSDLMDVAVHPDFSMNRWVYLTYSKPTESGSTGRAGPGPLRRARVVRCARRVRVRRRRGRRRSVSFVLCTRRHAIHDVGRRLRWTSAERPRPCEPCGQGVRLRDDGTAPDDNPFVGRGRSQAGSLLAGASQPDGSGHPPKHRSRLGQRACTHGGR